MENNYTTKSEIEARINARKQYLNETDYKAIKAFEGNPSKDWDEVKANREAYREEINGLEERLTELPQDEGGLV